MDISRVRYFLAACDHGSFTAAAKGCRVSRSSVAADVRHLERMAGGKLLERRPMRLTPLGEMLHPLLEELQFRADDLAAALVRSGMPVRQTRASRSLLGRGKPELPN